MTPDSILIALRGLNHVRWSPARRQEPITIGIPLPPGVVLSADQIRLRESAGREARVQVSPLDRWPDGSIRWALIDLLADSQHGSLDDYVLSVGSPAGTSGSHGLNVISSREAVQVATGSAVFEFSVGGPFPFSRVKAGDTPLIDAARSGVRIEQDEPTLDFCVGAVQLRDEGPLRAEVEVHGALRSAAARSPLEVSARVEMFAGTATVRMALTIRNPRRARHPSGQWVLGDTGSQFLRSAALVLTPGEPVDRARCAPERGTPLTDVEMPFEIYQESSGGDRWDAPTHRNRDGKVPLRFRGYRVRSGHAEWFSNRASPIVVACIGTRQLAIAVPQFWENFPCAVSVDGSAIEVGLFPRQFEDRHELQGGEQKSRTIVIAFDGDRVSDPPLAWTHDASLLYPAPDWCCATGVVPLLVAAGEDPNAGYLQLVNTVLDPIDGFLAKREAADEYGWRNFGDLYADHESAFQPPDRPFVSHYNNQYDAVAGFAAHFLRTGDPRWWQLMTDLARHVRDIDIYHTREDKSAFNGGLFWHTYHYADAGTSTHRSYPTGIRAGGGPSAEHNYNSGLMLHYFMTGERASRDVAIGLGRWVLAMDDGRRTVFRWLAGGRTGLASASGSPSYHGPGRGAANSIVACLVAHRLTGLDLYAAKADELIRRCIGPGDDVSALNLLDAERRWYYTIFLQALGMYLHEKAERREFDEMFAYTRESLLHYARWMASHERPYLDHPEILEYPTETWAAQDLRKSEVFLWAAVHAPGDQRRLFLDQAQKFFDDAVRTLAERPSHRFTRPTVLVLSNGLHYSWFEKYHDSLPPPVQLRHPLLPGPARPFEPQKARALRRAKWLGAAATAAFVMWVSFLIRGYLVR